ncbi:hypothetical protein PAL_GLEAN10017444 [Pteropus alecto]|uniref:Uncharacterized protein n=1 Tax=Pteropus alecto TaxID=9402 RepID=L5K324_PTEAL|nr:hypothetical protein PAL_GLEAN10017444 [Pteropus alecto]
MVSFWPMDCQSQRDCSRVNASCPPLPTDRGGHGPPLPSAATATTWNTGRGRHLWGGLSPGARDKDDTPPPPGSPKRPLLKQPELSLDPPPVPLLPVPGSGTPEKALQERPLLQLKGPSL